MEVPWGFTRKAMYCTSPLDILPLACSIAMLCATNLAALELERFTSLKLQQTALVTCTFVHVLYAGGRPRRICNTANGRVDVPKIRRTCRTWKPFARTAAKKYRKAVSGDWSLTPLSEIHQKIGGLHYTSRRRYPPGPALTLEKAIFLRTACDSEDR